MFMSDADYKTTLQQNPDLLYHPEMIFSPNCCSRDFKYQEPEMTSPQIELIKQRFSNQNKFSPSAASSLASRAGNNSIYFDAYTGIDDDMDKQVKITNMIIENATNVTEQGRKRKIQTVEGRNQSFNSKMEIIPEVIP